MNINTYMIILKIFIIIVLILTIIFALSYIFKKDKDIYSLDSSNFSEHFEDKMDETDLYKEIHDPEFIDLYEVIYRDYTDIDYDNKIIFKKVIDNIKDKTNINILVGGSGVGKLCKKLKEKTKNVIGIDISENMVKKSQELYPNIKFIRGNLINSRIFDKNKFSHIFLDERVLNYNNFKDMTSIIQNSFLWLQDKGFLIVQIYNPLELQLAARYYSSKYIDNKGNIHGFTYLNDFSHDCYYIQDEGDKEIFYYYDKVILDNGKKRIKKTTFTFPEIEKVYDMILNNGFDILYKENIRVQIVGGYELVIFRKKKTTITVDELQKNNI